MPPRISLVHQFEQQLSETYELAFSPDGKRLASSDMQGLYLWQLDEQGCWDYERSLPLHSMIPPRFSLDGRLIAYDGEAALIRFIDTDGRESMTFPSPSAFNWAFSHDARWLVNSGEEDILLWNLASHQAVPARIPLPIPILYKKVDKPSGYVGRFLFTPDCQKVILWADGAQGHLHVCSFEQERKQFVLLKTLPQGLIDGVISPNGKLLAIVDTNNQVYGYKQEIYIYDLESLRLLHMFPQNTNRWFYDLLAFSPDSRYLASSKYDGWVDIFSLETFELIAQFAAHPDLSSHATEPIGGLDWSKTGFIATGGASVFEKNMNETDYTIKIWRVEDE